MAVGVAFMPDRAMAPRQGGRPNYGKTQIPGVREVFPKVSVCLLLLLLLLLRCRGCWWQLVAVAAAGCW